MFVFLIYSKQEGFAKNLELLRFSISSEDRSDISLMKQGNGKTHFWVFRKKTQNKRNKMALLSKIFTIEVPKHKRHKEHVCYITYMYFNFMTVAYIDFLPSISE